MFVCVMPQIDSCLRLKLTHLTLRLSPDAPHLNHTIKSVISKNFFSLIKPLFVTYTNLCAITSYVFPEIFM